MSKLFLSYRRADSPDTVKLLHERLTARLPRWTIFYDHRSIPAGQEFPERLRDEVASAKVSLVVIGPRWLQLLHERRGLAVDHVREEIRLALQSGNTVIPVVVGHASLPSESDLADFPDLLPLLKRNGRQLRPEPDFDGDLERLCGFLDEVGPGVGPGTILGGRYKILRTIGQGGMGVVFEADQAEPKRTVAIKMILEGMDTKEVLARFDAERQALGVMVHPNICKVHDAGKSPNGRPYFVMDYVRGTPITDYCDAKKLTPHQRIDLCLQVCGAVQHAHQKGIIHRDLKPSNVLVEVIDGVPVPKVIDFGLAKAISYRLSDMTFVSEHGKTIGTLVYSSPEQAEGRAHDVDTRTDVYSLGILLYEMLAGSPPFSAEDLKTAGEDAMKRTIRTQEPPKPSTKLSTSPALPTIAANRQLDPDKLKRVVRGDLDWIVMKALEKEPARRYASATSLADDIERYLNHEPISAGKPGVLHRIGKFYRRNRLPVVAASLVFLALTAGIIGTTWEWREAVYQKEQARLAGNTAIEEKERAVENEKLAVRRFDEKRQAMDDMLAQFGDKQLSTMPGTQPIRRVLFERGVEMYEGMFREIRDNPTVQVSLAERYAELGKLQSDIGTLEQALGPLKKGEAVLRSLVEQEPSNRAYKFRLAVNLYQIGYCCWEHRTADPGIPALRKSIQILAGLSGEDQKDFESALYLNLARSRLSALMTGTGEERWELNRTAYSALKQLVAERPNDSRALIGLARVAINSGSRAMDAGSDGEAEAFFEEGRQLTKRAVEVDPTDPLGFTNLRYSLRGLSQVYAKTNRVPKGIEVMANVVADFTKRATENPAVPAFQQSLAYTHDDLRKLYQRTGEVDKAVDSLLEIIRIVDALAQRDPQNAQHPIDSIDTSQNLADLYRFGKREAEAIAIHDKVIKQAEPVMRLHPASDTLLGKLLNAHAVRGQISFDVEQYEAARDAYQRGVDLFARYRASVKPLQELTQHNYLRCCRGLIEIAKARKQADVAIALGRELILPIKLDTFTSDDFKQSQLADLATLAGLLEDAGDVKEALRLKVLAFHEAKKMLGDDPKSNWYIYQLVFGAHRHLARLYRKVGDDRNEFEALRNYFREFEPYVRARDHSPFLAETADFNPRNLDRLRETFAKEIGVEGGLKRFTVPIEFEGVKAPFHFYVAESWPFLEDQFAWVEKVRKGKVPKEIRETFQRLYKLAKDNNVAFQDLCVYALGKGGVGDKDNGGNPIAISGKNTDVNAVLKELAEARREIDGGGGGPIGWRRFALKLITLAKDEIANSNTFRAGHLLNEARTYIDLDSLERLRNQDDRDVFTYYQYVQGAFFASSDQPEKGYTRVLESIPKGQVSVDPEFAIPAGCREFAMGWICLKQQHPAEAATWYRKAMDLGHPLGAGRLYQVYQKLPQSTLALPNDLQALLERAAGAATKDEAAPAAFDRLVAEERGRPAREAAAKRDREAQAATLRRLMQTALLQDLASQFRGLADSNPGKERREAYRKALAKEFEARGQVVGLDPSNVAAKELQADVAVRMAQSYRESQEAKAEVEWTERSANLNHVESLLQLADMHEKGTNVKADVDKAAHYRYLGHSIRGLAAFRSRRYAEALPDLIKAGQTKDATANDQDRLGMCYGKLGRWDEAIAAYTRCIGFDVKSSDATGYVLNTLEALIVAEKPDQLLELVEKVKEKGWTLPKTGPRADMFTALYHGFRAMALRMSAKDATEAELSMREITGKPGFAMKSGWGWDELEEWRKGTKLAPDRKMQVARILDELRGKASPETPPVNR